MTQQQQVLEEIRQAQLREPFMELLRQGLTRRTIEACIKEYCKEQGRHDLPPLRNWASPYTVPDMLSGT